MKNISKQLEENLWGKALLENKERKKRTKFLLEGILIVLALFAVFPLFLVLSNSLKTFSEVMTDVVALPKSLHWENYLNVIRLMNYPKLFLNTLLVTGLGVTGVVLFSSMAGYKLSRTKTKYSSFIFLPIICNKHTNCINHMIITSK